MRAAIATVLAALAVSAGEGGKIRWGTDHDKALAEAKESGKPVVVYFTGEG